jgi:translation initiation factor 1
MKPPDRLVYSTDDPQPGRRPKGPAPAPRTSSTTGTVYVERERKGRRGKTVTVITGLPGNEADLATLLKQLKATCGAGGTLKDRQLELQGDHRDKLVNHLRTLGYTVKPKGG